MTKKLFEAILTGAAAGALGAAFIHQANEGVSKATTPLPGARPFSRNTFRELGESLPLEQQRLLGKAAQRELLQWAFDQIKRVCSSETADYRAEALLWAFQDAYHAEGQPPAEKLRRGIRQVEAIQSNVEALHALGSDAWHGQKLFVEALRLISHMHGGYNAIDKALALGVLTSNSQALQQITTLMRVVQRNVLLAWSSEVLHRFDNDEREKIAEADIAAFTDRALSECPDGSTVVGAVRQLITLSVELVKDPVRA